MPPEAYEEISRLMGCYPIEINSALVSAQTRKRYYWTNIGPQDYNLFGFPTVAMPQPENKGILLKDVLESGYAPDDKSRCIQSSIGRTTEREYFKKNQGQMVAEPLTPYVEKKYKEFAEQNGYIPEMFNPYNSAEIKDKSPTLTTNCGGQTNSSTVMMFEPIKIPDYEKSKGQANRVYSVRSKSVTLLANGGGGGAKTGLYKIDLPDGEYLIRKLTPLECERLQTLPDNYTAFGTNGQISNTQRYKAIGNGWTVDVIAHIFSFLEGECGKQ
jgi:DNA (cytosine-5)-methyltransferase 3A